MTDSPYREDAILPSREEVELAAESSRILAKVQSDDGLKVRLNDGQELTLPKAATRLLSHLLTEMANGNAVTLYPIHAELTTQEAADFLNVSRPHLIKLLSAGDIPHHMVGTHRRVRFEDLQKYKRERKQRSGHALDRIAAQAQDLDLGY